MRIFHQTAKLPQKTAFLSGFKYQIEWKKGVENSNADYLSIAPESLMAPKESAMGHEVHLIWSTVDLFKFTVLCRVFVAIQLPNRTKKKVLEILMWIAYHEHQNVW